MLVAVGVGKPGAHGPDQQGKTDSRRCAAAGLLTERSPRPALLNHTENAPEGRSPPAASRPTNATLTPQFRKRAALGIEAALRESNKPNGLMRPHQIHAARAELREEVVVRPVASILGPLFGQRQIFLSASSNPARVVDPLVLDDGLRVAADLPILKDVVVVSQSELSDGHLGEGLSINTLGPLHDVAQEGRARHSPCQ